MVEYLTGERLILRQIRTDDLDNVFELIRQYPDVDEMFPLALVSELIIRKHFEMSDCPNVDKEVCLLITDLAGQIIGSIACFKGSRYIEGMELGYHMFRPADRGRGLITEALNLLADYLFKKKHILRLQINMEQANIPSRRVAEKCGFHFDGVIPNAIFSSGRWINLDSFSLLREEWLKMQAKPE